MKLGCVIAVPLGLAATALIVIGLALNSAARRLGW